MKWRGRARRALVATAMAMAALLVAGCSGLANLNIPTPASTVPSPGAPATTVVTDLSGVSLTPVPSAPPPPVLLTPGTASLSGIVTGPSGVVAGATVLVERLVGNAVGSKTVTAGADGTWMLPGILGGLYRVRAWMAPALDLTTPTVLLLGAGQTMQVSLTLMSYNGQSVSATISPSPPEVGQVATLIVEATQQAVGNDGIVRATALPGANIFVSAAGDVVLAGTNPGTSNAAGQMQLALGCSSVGPVGLSATLDGLNTFALTVPDCSVFVAPITIPTTIPAPTSSVP
jgi:Carboxypeptidase regulatory-like domain